LDHHELTTATPPAERRFQRRIKQRAVVREDGTAILGRDDLGRGLAVLTQRELEVLKLMADGRRRAEIAESLGLTVRSLREVRRGLMAKLGARTDQHATAVAFRRGVLRVDRRGADGGGAR
jgi:DNA-binding CsgD family transcriptional regulator